MRYENERFGFAVRLPSACRFTESQNGDGIGITLAGRPGLRIGVYGGHDVWGIRDVEGLRRFHDDLLGDRRSHAVRIQLGDLRGLQYVDMGTDRASLQRVFLRGGVILGLHLKAAPRDLPTGLGLFEQVCGSLETCHGCEDPTPAGATQRR